MNLKAPRQLFVEQAHVFLWETDQADWKADTIELSRLLGEALKKSDNTAAIALARASMRSAQEASTQQQAQTSVRQAIKSLPADA